MELVVLSSDSKSKNGCDRVILAESRVVVQGVPVLGHPDFASVSVPAGETLTAISGTDLPGSGPRVGTADAVVSMVDVFALCENVTEEAFRLEARQRYNVPYEETLIRAFKEGELPPENESITRHMASVNSLRAAGKRDYRVHVIELPLTPYLRYELDGYRENIEAGEEIFIADRAWHFDLVELTEDFMLLDGGTDHASVVWYRYNANDELLARDLSHDPADIGVCRRWRDVAMAHAIPYAEFMRRTSVV